MELSLALAAAHVKMRPMKGAGDGAAATRVFAVVAIAMAGLLFALTPASDRIEGWLLDLQWSALRRYDLRPAPDDIVIVGIDDASVERIREPRGLWHEPLGAALARIAAARPRAIGLDLVLPDRSQDAVRPGVDRALLLGLAAARRNGPFVATLSIDSRTRSARPIHAPFLAVLEEPQLGIGLLGRDADGVVRRFSILVPTEDGGFPTLAGRLCRALSRQCGEGFIHFALGGPLRQVPLHQVLDTTDTGALERAFRDRIVLIGETAAFTGRIEVPVNYAGWERAPRDSPSVVVHAQALRTALAGTAPVEASRPLLLILVAVAALVYLARDWRLALVTGALAIAFMLLAATLMLRGGLVLPLGAAFATVVLACVAGAARDFSRAFAIRRR